MTPVQGGCTMHFHTLISEMISSCSACFHQTHSGGMLLYTYFRRAGVVEILNAANDCSIANVEPILGWVLAHVDLTFGRAWRTFGHVWKIGHK